MLSEAKHLAERYQSAVISDIVMLGHRTWNDPLERVA